MKNLVLLTVLNLGLTLALGASAFAQDEVDPKLPKYVAAGSGVTGNVKSEGSDTMNNLMTLWAEGFQRIYPNVQVEIQGKGSSTAPSALIEGTATFGPMSREMKAKEIDAFQKEYGYAPTGLRTSLDVLAVYVHKDNPIAGLSLQQVDAIFSKSRNGGFAKDIVTWGDLGLGGEWASKPISLYGRNSVSGTYGYFKDNALFKGDFKDSVKEQPGSSAVVSAVAGDKFAIGYSGIGYKTADVRAVPLASEQGGEAIEAVGENAYNSTYPLARFLYMYVNYDPNAQLDPLRREFVRYVFSQQGQMDVVKDGYLPIPATIAAECLAEVGLSMDGKTLEAGFQKEDR